jgi:hypothetical protein
VAYEIFVGSLPEGVDLLHRCDQPSCVNPEHLFIGDQVLNNIDRDRKLRLSHKLTLDKVMAIRSDPRSHRLIAKDYNINQSDVSRIKSRKRWGWI